MDSDTKHCSKCGEIKALELFSKNRTLPDGLQSYCKQCNASWRSANRDRRAALGAVYYAANRKRICERQAVYHATTAPRRRVQKAAYRKANSEKIKAHYAAYCKAHPEYQAGKKAARRARKRALDSATTPQERAAVREIYRKAALAEGFTGEPFAVDHRHPVARGGSSLAENLQHIPYRLNASKGAKTHEEALATVPGYADWCEGPPTFN